MYINIFNHCSRKQINTIELPQNYLSTVPSIALRNRQHHIILNFNKNKINGFYVKAIKVLDTLEIFIPYENEIAPIEANAFKGLDKYDISIYLLLFYTTVTGRVLIVLQIMLTFENENVSTW